MSVLATKLQGEDLDKPEKSGVNGKRSVSLRAVTSQSASGTVRKKK